MARLILKRRERREGLRRSTAAVAGFAIVAMSAAPAGAIVGGEPESGPVARRLVQVGVCTGVVLARDVVLTAAHCVTGNVKWRDAQGQMRSIPTRESSIAPAFKPGETNPGIPTIDLSLLRLRDSLPAPFVPAELSAEPVRLDERVVITGFGESIQGYAESAGALRSAAMRVIEPFGYESEAIWMERGGAAGACKGDSGGAVTRDGPVVGVITSILGYCGYRTRAILLGPQKRWIDGAMDGWGRKASWRAPAE
ncbi:MAG: hypothetical protein BGP06_03995 [Rhizobiales bacterium 65-9]|nr:MAG: hypothetical protein BGP06_03995 [Rhizobiales bacterium 65-9]